MHEYALGVDVGGTFTDVVLSGGNGVAAVAKVLSTHHDPAEGVLDGVRRVLAAASAAPGEVGRVVHATTLATNAVLERRGVRVAFVTTLGFGDLLPLGRYARVEEDRYDLRFDPPAPPVAREDCFEVPERVDASGRVLRAVDPDDVRRIAREIAARGVEAVAVCLLHAYANPAHETVVARVLREELGPEVTVVTGSDVWPEVREYERATTTLMSAYVGPVMEAYLGGLSARLRAVGITPRVQVMESGGGVMSAELAGRRAVATIESGPAAGALAAAEAGRQAGFADVISFDMGGTTAKVCVIQGGRPRITHEFHVGGKGSFGGRRAGTGVPIKTPAIDLAEVGAGGGSVAWVDDGGTLKVGPRSAGSSPGPACYGLGGGEPTVTDANLVLGYLAEEGFAGGSMRLDRLLAEKAVDRLAAPLGVGREDAAHAVHEIANAAMGSAVHVVTVQRGIDPRGFAMVAFGGAGPAHAARVAERFGIGTVIVPPSCGVGSAVGLLATDLSTDRVRTRPSAEPDPAVFEELAAEGAADLEAPPSEAIVERSLDLRFRGQAHEITVPYGEGPGEDFREEFFRLYEQVYGIRQRGPTEVVSYRVRVTRPVDKPPQKAPASAAPGPPGRRRAWFPETGGHTEVPVHRRAGLGRVTGPAIVADAESTIVVPPGWDAAADENGNVVLARRA
ncbi:hydantoinase/oxoprolinase family protein [Bailinhaonella thermotolerans]|uniref:Hydantoinase/oxoprolinase family protein n=1 Tax=Bailinhaonella thermotolerans TaxID=1070861 RepID=A0A3A3ZYM8_9ACTN|nr:hydantoinase/oxoprolinase family protein [Bailinhaonella thermotolerans]RJL20535.1 hydantoinase/oxoprolinase family protein [Bailinhaonella thermotolerans]